MIGNGADSAPGRRRRGRSPGTVAAYLMLTSLVGRLPPSATVCHAAAAEPRPLARRLPSRGNHTTNTCKPGGVITLLPGDNLTLGEFLCHGLLRFGIDAADGRVVLGFADNATAADGAGARVAPAALAWAAAPNKLFIPRDRPFRALALAPGGNLLGYDAAGEEIYDSNYDYRHRHEGKVEGSRLRLADRCAAGAAGLRATVGVNGYAWGTGGKDGAGGGTLCLTITSPQLPGHARGMITWGVAVRADALAPAAPPAGSAAPSAPPTYAQVNEFPLLGKVEADVAGSSLLPPLTSRPTRSRAPRPSTPSPVVSPTDPPAQNMFSQSKQPDLAPGATETAGFESLSIIWGTVWRDTNRNGKMDIGESTVQDLELCLWSCDVPKRDDGGAVVERGSTNADGTYYLQVPAGRNYTLHFDLAAYSVLSFSVGQDADTDAEGWTSCEGSRNDRPIQWNAGLYDVYESSSSSSTAGYGAPMAGASMASIASIATSATPLEFEADSEAPLEFEADSEATTSEALIVPAIAPSASIGGFIYLDTDESGTMSDQEHAAAVGGYTVKDALLGVTLTDCVTSVLISKQVVQFPGIYSFGNLSEGWYRLGYATVMLARNAHPVPLYSFVEGAAENSTVFETDCGKLGHAEAIDSGNVGLRMAPLDITDKGSAGGPIGPQAESADAEAVRSGDGGGGTSAPESRDETTEGGLLVPVLVGVVATLVVIAAVVFATHRRGDASGNLNTQFTKTRSRDAEDDLRGCGLPQAKGDDAFLVPATPTSKRSMGCEPGGKSGAALTDGMGDAGDSNSDCDNDARESDKESEEKGETGFARGGDSGVRVVVRYDGGSGGGSPYQGVSTSAVTDSHSHMEANNLEEGSSEGYEVYDDDDDKSSQGNKDADYGHVISNMIAKYSQKQSGGQSADELLASTEDGQGHTQGEQQDCPSQNYQKGHDHLPSQNYDYQRHSQEGQEEINHDYPDASATQAAYPQYHNQARYQDHHQAHPQDQNQAECASVQDGALPHYQHHQGDSYYSNNAYGNAPHNQYQRYNDTNDYSQQPQQQCADDSSLTSGTSRPSRASADPPAASYRDISVSNTAVGWDASGIPQQQPVAGWNASGIPPQQPTSGWDASGVPPQRPMAGWDESGVSPQQPKAGWDTAGFDVPQSTLPRQRAMENYGHKLSSQAKDCYNGSVDDVGAYAVTENYDDNPDQYMANGNDDAYAVAIDYESDHNAVNNHEGVHVEDGTHVQNHRQNEAKQSYDQAIDQVSSSSSDSDLSSDEEEIATVKISDAIGQSLPSSEGSNSSAHRAQSNPRDNRQSTWTHSRTAAIPENSTVEYNTYTAVGTNNADHDGVDYNNSGHNNAKGGCSASTYDTTPPQAAAEDNKSVGSDQSADPPGAWYKHLHQTSSSPPRLTPPPSTRVSPNPNATSRGRSVPNPPPRGGSRGRSVPAPLPRN